MVHVNHSPIHANLDLYRTIKKLICLLWQPRMSSKFFPAFLTTLPGHGHHLSGGCQTPAEIVAVIFINFQHLCLIPSPEFEEDTFCFLNKCGIKVKEMKSSPIKEFYSPFCWNISLSLKERSTKNNEMIGFIFVIDTLKGTGNLWK